MKKILFILTVFISIVANGQATLIDGGGGTNTKKVGEQISDSLENFVIDVANMKAGVFNVLDYGATGTGEEITGYLQEAIDDAYASMDFSWKYAAAKVVIPYGNYTWSDTVFMRSGVTVECVGEPYFSIPSTYRSILLIDGGIEAARRFKWIGGYFLSTYNGYTFCKFLHNAPGDYSMGNTISDINMQNPNIGFDIELSNRGYSTSNTVKNITIWNPRTAIKTRKLTGSSALDAFVFDNIMIQAGDSTRLALDSITGQWNSFTNVMFWDFDNNRPYAIPYVIASGSYQGNYEFLDGESHNNNGIYSSKANFFHNPNKDLGFESFIKHNGRLISAKGTPVTIQLSIAHPGHEGADTTFASAANTTAQNIDLGTCIPANAKVLAVRIVNLQATPAEIMFTIGNVSGGNQFLTSSSCNGTYEVAENASIAVSSNYSSATHVWVGATPSANWNTYNTGNWRISITYIKY